MSELGLCSRREADEWIENGWVKVDGDGGHDARHARVARTRASRSIRRPRDHQSEQVTILLNKPVGYVSGQAEDGYEPAIVLIRPENRWAEDPSPTAVQADATCAASRRRDGSTSTRPGCWCSRRTAASPSS